MLNLLPPLRIHAWGGFGSQLFAIALAEDLKHRFPNRVVRIVLHTGGVTRRLPEVLELFPEYAYSYEEDFRQPDTAAPEKSAQSSLGFRKSFKIALTKSGFLAACNDDIETKKLLPWILSIRGHYSYRSINSEFLSKLNGLIESFEPPKIGCGEEICCVHYRLGDLLTLTEKSPISPFSVLSEYSRIKGNLHFLKLIVFSDSPLEARLRFPDYGETELETPDLKTIQVLANSVSAKYFIGTSSKISFWIAAIRAVVHQRNSSLPIVNVDQYSNLLGRELKLICPYNTDSQ